MAEYIDRGAAVHALMKIPNTPQKVFDVVCNVPTADVVPVLPCPNDCVYKATRHQKCSCCARNRNLKDCYIPR